MNKKDLAKVHTKIPSLVDQHREGKLDRREFLRTTTLLGLSSAAAYALSGEIIGDGLVEPAAAQEGTFGGTLKIQMKVMEITDPAIFDWSEKGNVSRQIIEPLALVGTDNVTRPYLAESWEANDDLSVWTFKLRQGVKWNNGDELIADDVVATFERWLDPATGSSNQGRFSALTVTEGETIKAAPGAVEKVDDYTVQFNLTRPMLQFPESLGDYPALITHRSLGETIASGSSFQENPIGTGPYTLDDLRVGEFAAVNKRPAEDYWGDEVYLDRIEWIDLGDDPQAHFAALASGQVDLLYTLDVNLVGEATNTPGVAIFDKLTAVAGVARMRITEPPFDNKAVRKAIQACIDRNALVELAYADNGTPGEDHHVSPIHPEYSELPPPPVDYEQAKAYLAEAGFPDGLDIKIQCISDPKWESDIALVLAQMVKPAGINLEVEILPGGTYWDRWTSWPFSVTQWTSRPLGVQVLSLAYRSGVAWNETNYANPEFDAVLDQAEATIDIEERRALVLELQKMLQDDAIIILPFWLKIYTAGNEKVQGYAYHIAREQHLRGVYLTA
ncbi:MAG: ABC transporter substrate-binding protein [Pseudomonadota bacterium]